MQRHNSSRYAWLTVASIVGMASGFTLGVLAHSSPAPAFDLLTMWLKPVEMGWVMAIRIAVVPLLISYIFVAIAQRSSFGNRSRVIRWALSVHAIALIIGTAISFVVAWLALNTISFSTEIANLFLASSEASQSGSLAAGSSAAQRFFVALSENPVFEFVNANLLSIIFTAFFMAFLTSLCPATIREPVVRVFQWVRDISGKIVGLIIVTMPLGVFALSYATSLSTGWGLLSALAFYVVMISGALIVVTILLYPPVGFFGGVKIKKFARAVAPAQAVAFGTRSSMLCLAPLVEGARNRLHLPKELSETVLPISVSAFKLDMLVTTPVEILFLTQLFSIDLGVASCVVLFVMAFASSFGTAGIPSSGTWTNLPFYLAAGIPVEAVILLNTVDAIPDIFKTIMNVTEDLAITTIVAKKVSLIPTTKTDKLPSASSPSESVVPAVNQASID